MKTNKGKLKPGIVRISPGVDSTKSDADAVAAISINVLACQGPSVRYIQ